MVTALHVIEVSHLESCDIRADMYSLRALEPWSLSVLIKAAAAEYGPTGHYRVCILYFDVLRMKVTHSRVEIDLYTCLNTERSAASKQI